MSDFTENLAEIRGIRRQNDATSPTDPNNDNENQPLLPSTTLQPHGDTSYNQQTSTSGVSDEEVNRPSSRSTTMPLFFTLSTVFGASSVLLGAFGAHGLKRRISDPSRLANWSTASQYQLVHSVALLATSLALPRQAQKWPGGLFIAGMTMFSGSIYLLVLDPQRFKVLGPVTPLGGLCLIGGWVALGVVGRRFVR